MNDTISASAVTVNSKGGILQIESRVSDKKSGDIGHPVQYDTAIGQWYITVNDNNEIYNTVVGLEQLLLVQQHQKPSSVELQTTEVLMMDFKVDIQLRFYSP